MADKVLHGRIIKADNNHVRTVLPESMAGVSLRHPGAKKAKNGQVVPRGRGHVHQGVEAPQGAVNHLVGRGLPVNKTKIAVVNELIR